MWLIRAIDCSDSYRAFSSQTNIPTSLTAFESDFACSFGKALSNTGLDVFALPMLWWTHLFHYWFTHVYESWHSPNLDIEPPIKMYTVSGITNTDHLINSQ